MKNSLLSKYSLLTESENVFNKTTIRLKNDHTGSHLSNGDSKINVIPNRSALAVQMPFTGAKG